MRTLSPGRLVLTTLLATIGIGTGLLWWFEQGRASLSFIDAAFMATSATTVTGLTPYPFGQLSDASATLIGILIQVGGLGVVTLSLFVMSLFFPLGLGTQRVAGEIFEVNDWRFGRHLLLFSGTITLIIESIGTLFVWLSLAPSYSGIRGFGYALFHCVSTFCSAGISIFPNGIMPYTSNLLFVLTTILLMLVSTIGFIPLFELFRALRSPWHGRHAHLSLHTRLVCSITAMITIIGFALLLLLDGSLIAQGNTILSQGLTTLFAVLSYRGVGFSFVSATALSSATLLLIMALSFIGGSPTSTESGIKTTTFTIVIGAIRAVILGRYSVELRGREIPNDQVFKAMAIFALHLLSIVLTTFLLTITEPYFSLGAILFESVSACCNLGLSLDVTQHLSYGGKIILIFSMIIGRIGSLSAILALRKRSERAVIYHYPEERVIIG